MVVERGMLEVLYRRESLLRRLADEPGRPAELAAELESSRSTIERGVSELEDAALVDRADDCYRPTTAGELALAEFSRFVDRLDCAAAASELVAELPTDAPLSWQLLDGAAVVTSDTGLVTPGTDGAPLSDGPDDETRDPGQTFEALLETGTRHRAVAPGLTRHIATTYRDAICDGLEVEAVVSDAAIQTLLTDFQESTADALATGQLTLCEVTRTLPYGLLVIERDRTDTAGRASDEPTRSAVNSSDRDGLVSVVVCSDGAIDGLLLNDSAAAFEWASAKVDALQERAQPLPVSEGS